MNNKQLIISIIGRKNVGKSTLFNKLTNTKHSIIEKISGTTRDRKIGFLTLINKKIILIDTGGLNLKTKNTLENEINKQTENAIQESNLIFFVVDFCSGLVPEDYSIKKLIKKFKKEVVLIVNKSENFDNKFKFNEFYTLGFKEIFFISTSRNIGLLNIIKIIKKKLITWTKNNNLINFPIEKENFNTDKKYNFFNEIEEKKNKNTKIGVIGRPNVGKSTLINILLKENRVITENKPGTTRDCIFIPIKSKYNNNCILIDTAGIYRKNKNIKKNNIEKLSIQKSFKIIRNSNILIFLIDAREQITHQDLKILQYTQNLAKPTLILVNKWDLISQSKKHQTKKIILFRLKHFLNFIIYFISALHAIGTNKILKLCNEIYQSSKQKITSAKLTKILILAVKEHSPPLVNGKIIKLNFAHPGGYNPLRIIIHGKMLNKLLRSYKKYLINYFQNQLKLKNTTVIIHYKNNNNPYH